MPDPVACARRAYLALAYTARHLGRPLSSDPEERGDWIWLDVEAAAVAYDCAIAQAIEERRAWTIS